MNKYTFDFADGRLDKPHFCKYKNVALFAHNAIGMEFYRADEVDQRIKELEADPIGGICTKCYGPIDLCSKCDTTRVPDELLELCVEHTDMINFFPDEWRKLKSILKARKAVRDGTI